MNKIQIFKNQEFGHVRTIEENGKVLFCAKDVAISLGYKDQTNAIKQHCRGVVKRHLTDNLGREQLTNFISEGDIYRLAAKSELPGAERFESWIFDEVLPSIHKHGAYLTADTIEAVLSDPDTIIKLATTLKEEKAKRNALEAELDRSKEWYSIKRVAHMNDRSHKDFDWRKLKKESMNQGYGVKKIFDANYGFVNTYHMDVWEAVYPHMEL